MTAAPETEPDGFGRHMVRGAAWMVAMRWAIRLVGLVSTIILARLLMPADFGIVAMATVVIGFLEVFTHTGVDLALIRKQNLERADLDSGWTFEVLKGAALAAVLFAVAPMAATYYDEPRVTEVIQLLGLGALILGFQNIGVIEFRRDLDFGREFRFGVYRKLLSFVFVVGLALYLRSYWALVFGSLFSQLVAVWLSYRMHPYRPRFAVSRIGQIWSFSQWLLVSRIARFINARVDIVLAGRLFGTASTGHYHVASEVSTAPTGELVMPMARGLYPVYSRMADDPQALAAHYLQALSAITLVCISAGFGIAAVAEDMTAVLLGANWADAVPLIQWLGIAGGLAGLTTSVEALLTANGRVRLLAGLAWGTSLLLVPSLLIAGTWGDIEHMAMARAGVALVMIPIVFAIVSRASAVSLPSVAWVIGQRLVAGLVMVAAVREFHLDGLDLPAVTLALDVAVGATVFTATTFLTWSLGGQPPGPERTIVDMINRIAARALGRRATAVSAQSDSDATSRGH